ncbi:MAG: SMP-30/gluconolactonase/LRE family protein [Thermoguttaceae bacterium]
MPLCSIELLYDAKAVLGEGPFWHPTEKRLYWLDIEGMLLHRFDPVRLHDEIFPLGRRVGCVVPVEKADTDNSISRLLIAAYDGIHEIEIPAPQTYPNTLETGKILSERLITHPESPNPDNRYNDGKCSPEGRFWFGSMSLIKKKENAALYVLEEDDSDANCFQARKVVAPATTSNGLGWSLDGKTMYWADTPTLKVFAFDYDRLTGDITNRRVAVEFPTIPNFGRPDGLTVDSEGMLWIGHWMGNAISRWNPNTGEMLEKYPTPVHRTTSMTFGGENLDTLFITTAQFGRTDDEAQKEPHAGSLFVCNPNVRGLPVNFFRTKPLV